ncbi:MAG: hypothetical protein MI742_12615 [Desulfobacterales bacterium]|nr:hypothetical protein [Desulfobacterales bacterium]
MKWLKKIQKFLPEEYAVWVPVILVLLVLLIVVVVVVKKRKGKAAKDAAPKPKEVEEAPSISPKSLIKAWKSFLHQIPGEFRRIIMVYQHFVVFGESGSGKSMLINNHTDWQGHARQFYPSYTANPLLQVYLGTKVLVQEIPASILNDTTKAARIALLKLWKPLFRRKDPTAVVVLNAASFQTDEPLFLKKEAQMLRGKINLLARIRRKPIQVRMVLTNMESQEGFTEFARFLKEHRIPLKLEFNSKEDLTKISECLVPYEAHLSRALISLPAADYLKIITFLESAPELLGQFYRFISVLQSPDPLTPEPEVVTLSLAFLSDENSSVSNPFETLLTSTEIQKFNPLFRHRIAAAVLGIVGVAYLVGAFIYEHQLIQERYDQIRVIEQAPLSQYNQNIHKLFVDPLSTIKQQRIVDLLPDFFPQANREIFRRGIENIRNYYLLPELEKFTLSSSSWDMDALDEEDQVSGRSRVLYLMGILYSTKRNDLGKLVMENIDVWADNTGLSRLLIEDYVNFNTDTSDITLDMDDYIYNTQKSVVDNPLAITVFFEKVKKAYFQSVMTSAEFKAIRDEAEEFLARIHELERYDLSVKISDLLRREAMLSINTREVKSQDFKTQIQNKPVKEFLRFLIRSRISRPDVTTGMNMADLYENLKVMKAYKGLDTTGDAFFQFVLAGRDFKFSAALWNDLLNRSRMSFLINDFMKFNAKQEGTLFFNDNEEFPDLVMNGINTGMFLFQRQGRVDGRFTHRAFLKRVKPVTTELPGFINELPIPERDKTAFSKFLYNEVDAYGESYAAAYRNYYLDFNIGATSLSTLRLVLQQLTRPSSPLMDVLISVKENTLLEIGDNSYLHAFAKHMVSFEFLGQLLAEEKGVYPEMDTYKSLLTQMLLQVDAMGGGDAQPGKFEERLSPLARVSYAMLLGSENSFLTLMSQWVDSVGIPPEWERAFMEPVLSAYRIGKPEIEREVSLIWDKLYERDIKPLHDLFPFNRTSGRDVPLATLGRATHPNGHFWQVFRDLLGSFVEEDQGIWALKPTPLESFEVPGHMLPTVNAIQRLTTTLWDSNGDQVPLTFMVKAYPLPRLKAGEPVVSLSFLHVSDFSIFGFNQKPSWQVMQFDWSRESSASVGMELTSPSGRKSKLYNAVTVGRSAWSFYHLLQRSENSHAKDALAELSAGEVDNATLRSEELGAEPTIFTWVVKYQGRRRVRVVESGQVGSGDTRGYQLSFAIRSRDPWAIFRLPK